MDKGNNVKEILQPVINTLLEGLKEACIWYQAQDSCLMYNNIAEEVFCEEFCKMYTQIMHSYMKDNVRELDRHKVASVMIIASIKAGVISYQENKLKPGTKSIAQEMIATEVALSWMLQRLNEKLTALCQRTIEHYFMPEAFVCPTPYFEIFCRNLYYSNQGNKLNALDIADKLFLIEYITLCKNGIDPTLLKFDD